MNTLNVRNANQALPLALAVLVQHGKKRESRVGDVLSLDVPVSTLYTNPWEMCVFHAERNLNPFATLFEGIWMLAGHNAVQFPAKFLPKMKEFSDDGTRLHGAYGYRWRHHFGKDQIDEVITNLKANPNCRRQMIQMWDPAADLSNHESKDLPCNTSVNVQVIEGRLCIVVFLPVKRRYMGCVWNRLCSLCYAPAVHRGVPRHPVRTLHSDFLQLARIRPHPRIHARCRRA